MKKTIFLFFALLTFTLFSQELFAQEKNTKEPEYVIIAENEIITKEKLLEYGKKDLVKSMQKGVTQDVRNKLAEKFGDKIGYRKFIVLVDLRTKQEKVERQKQANTINSSTADNQKRENGLKLNVGDVAKDFTVQMLDGREITLSNLKGKVVLLNFWATWCAPCLMEFAEMPEKILEPFENEKFVFIPISIGEGKMKVRKTMAKMQEYGVDFNVGLDLNKKIWKKYATGAIPKNFIIDKNGVIKYVSVGNAEGSVDKLATEIEKLLAE